MMMRKTLFLLYIVLLGSLSQKAYSHNQVNFDFGTVTAASFVLPDSPLLREAGAVVLMDKGDCSFFGSKSGDLVLSYKRHLRILIKNNNGFDAANFELHFQGDVDPGDDDTKINAVTYNLKNGVVTETLLQKEQVFLDKISQRHYVKKFTMPAIVSGSIIDIQYSINTQYFEILPTWYFQSVYPTLYSEFQVEIPEFLKYLFAARGYNKFFIDEQKEYYKSLTLVLGHGMSNAGYISFDGNALLHRWAMKDIPALKEEPFTSSIKNHLAQIRLQLTKVVFKGYDEESLFLSSWTEAVKKLNKDKYFGAELYYDNFWLDNDMKALVGDLEDTLAKAKKIFDFVKDQFICTGNGYIDIDKENIRKVYKDKSGNSSEINLLLVAMLQHEHIDAYPLILSTRNNGYVSPEYPLLLQYNRTITYTRIGGVRYYLDASDSLLSFGKLNTQCYNGPGMVIVSDGIPIDLNPDNVKERKLVNINLTAGKDHLWEGIIAVNNGYYESLDIRKKIKEIGNDQVIGGYKLPDEQVLVNQVILDNPGKLDDPVVINYHVGIGDREAGTIYLNPFGGAGINDNPFKSEKRLYPVEMRFVPEETIVVSIDIPEGYIVDELPKSVRMKLNEDDGSFDYIIQVVDDKILLRSKLSLKRANFPAEDYDFLRNFYTAVVKKHSEQIVLKKK